MSSQGYVSPFNDDQDTVPDESVLLRRVPPVFTDWLTVDAGGRPRITSAAFQDYSAKKALDDFGLPGACMSVVVLHLLQLGGKDPTDLLFPFGPTHGFAELLAGAVRTCNQGVHPDPRPGEPWHAVVFAMTRARRNNTEQSCLANRATWHLAPERE